MTIGLHVVAAEESPSYSFKHEGPLILSSDLGHLCIEVNISQIETGIQIAKNTLKHVQQVADSIRSNIPTIDLLLAMSKSEINDIEKSYDDLVAFFTNKEVQPRVERSTVPSSQKTRIVNNKLVTNDSVSRLGRSVRHKCQLVAMAMGLLGFVGGATLFGYIQNDKIEALEDKIADLSYRQNKIVHLLSTQNQEISVNRDHITHLAGVLQEVVKMLTLDHTTTKLEAGAMYIHHIVSRVRSLMNKYLNIVQAASVQRLAAQAISATGATTALNTITAMAQAKGLKPVISNIAHFHQLPTSYTVTEFGLRIPTFLAILIFMFSIYTVLFPSLLI